MSKEARTARLIQLQDGFAAVEGDGDVHTVLFQDVVGVEVSPDGRVLFSQHGCVVPVSSKLWVRVNPAITRIDEQVPKHLHFASPDQSDNTRPI